MAERVAVVLATVALLVVGAVSPAAGTVAPPDPAPPPDTCPDCRGTGGSDDHYIEATAAYESSDSSGGGPVPVGSSYLDGCHWSKALAGETRDLHPTAGAWTVTFDVDHWLVWCPPRVIVYTYFPVGDPPPPFVIQDLIDDAYERTPVVFFNPRSSPVGTDGIPLITQMRTYFWVDDTLWQPVSAIAEIPGIFSVTTTAVPTTATFTGGDEPPEVECDRGTPYQIGAVVQDESCTTIFTHSSDTVDHAISVSVEWEVSYTCSIPTVCGGPLPSIFTVSSRTVTVGEIQALER